MCNFIDLSDLDYKPIEIVKKENPKRIFKKVLIEFKNIIKLKEKELIKNKKLKEKEFNKILKKHENTTIKLKKQLISNINKIFNINLYSNYTGILYKIKYFNIISELKHKFEYKKNIKLYLYREINKFVEKDIKYKKISEYLAMPFIYLKKRLNLEFHNNYNYLLLKLKLRLTKYDLCLLDYDNTYTHKYFNLLNFDKSENILSDYISLINSIYIQKHKLSNNYISLKLFAIQINYGIILYDCNYNILDSINIRNFNKIFVLFNNNKIYLLTNEFNIFHKFNLKFKLFINNCLNRDIIKNSKLVLFENIDNYHNNYIYFSKMKYSTFKYYYLFKDLYLKKISDLTNENKNILKYLIENFGLHFSLINNIVIINKKNFTKDFIINNNYLTYSIMDVSLYDYKINENINTKNKNYYYIYNENIIKGNSKEEIYDICKTYYNIEIDCNNILQLKTILSLSEINNYSNIVKQFENTENITLINYNYDTSKILAINKINTNNFITLNYILNLSEKTTYCKYCNCILSTNICDKNIISIDAYNPLLGHIINNIDLICGKCNLIKGSSYIDKYNKKPYFYDIDTLNEDKLKEILEYHKLDNIGEIPILRKRLIDYLKTI